jgi:Fis family transcriptional regulator
MMSAEGERVAATLHIERARIDPKEPLRNYVRDALETYFAELNGHHTSGLYRLVISEVEAPLLETVMRYTRGNHSKAAELLGINRGTLRKKLKEHNLA